VTDALLFDFNGVIVDDEPLHCEAFLAVLSEEGLALTRDEYYAEYLGLDDRTCFRQVLSRDGRPPVPGDVTDLVARKGERYLSLADRSLPLVPGAAEFVRAAARTRRVAIVSGALRREIALGLERAGIADAVSVIVTSDDVATSKPDPAGFHLALRLLAAREPGPWRAVVIEDSLPGLAAARAIGAGCLMLATAHEARALAAADRVWTSFESHHPDELGPLFREVAVDREV
jgi:HAD superfamily hydrolase (TIGR01509 family)